MLHTRFFVICCLMAAHASSLLPAAPLVAVVTGGNRGLGFAIARHLLHHSEFTVVLASRSYAAGQAAASALLAEFDPLAVPAAAGTAAPRETRASRVVAMQLDVAHATSVDTFCARVLAAHGPPTVLINNAAICCASSGRNGALDLADLQRSLAVNLNGPVRLVHQLFGNGPSRAATDALATRAAATELSGGLSGGGSVINVSSGDGELAFLNPRLAAALRHCRTPADVIALASLDAATTDDAATADAAAAGAGSSGGLLLQLVSCGDELAFGPSPAYAVSKALLNAWTRTAGKDSGDSSGGDSGDSSGRSTSSSSNHGGGAVGLSRVRSVNSVCPGDVVGSRMYSGAACGEGSAQWRYAATGDIGGGVGAEEGTGVDRWDVTVEEAARDVCALIGTEKTGAFFRFGSEVPW
jgi:NAD(P)-dependent dehydrogenase (short-subunit alcohol dehydrogenase family)